MAPGKSNPTAVRGGSALLAILFLLLGGLRLLGPQLGLDAGEPFTHYPGWVGPLMGGIEVAAALALLVPQVAWVGAAVLLAVMAGYMWLSWQSGQPAQMLLPGLLFLSCAALFYLRFPRRSVAAGR
jgi:hypothetical protein